MILYYQKPLCEAAKQNNYLVNCSLHLLKLVNSEDLNFQFMTLDFRNKSTNDEIRERFDIDVERFSNMETGQQSAIDAPLSLELITEAAFMANPTAENLLDIGCGAGNYTLKMLRKLPQLHCTLVDLSRPMLQKANERVKAETKGQVKTIQGDVREVPLPSEHYDIILAGAVLHHLRDDADWRHVFEKIYNSLKQGGSFWAFDLVSHNVPEIHALFWDRYGDYLLENGGAAYKEKVFEYIEKEDSPRSVTFQLDMMKSVGFREVEILHKNASFAAFGGIKR